MNNEEFIDIILNKKFTKAVFSGYDTTDVDKFYDLVIDYLKQNDLSVAQYKKTAEEIKIENSKLRQELELLKSVNNNLTKQIEQYELDGYGNVIKGKMGK